MIKIPITNTRAESAAPLVQELTAEGLRLNVTAIMTAEQVEQVADTLSSGPGAIVSVFAGRIADTGRDPVPIMQRCVSLLESTSPGGAPLGQPHGRSSTSTRRTRSAVDIITLTSDLLGKLSLYHKDLDEYSLDTVRMFHDDAVDRRLFPVRHHTSSVIITRTPLRVSLGGGGTDLPRTTSEYGGLVIAAAIDKYVFVAMNRTFTDDYFLKYSALERVTTRSAESSTPSCARHSRRTRCSRPWRWSAWPTFPSGTGSRLLGNVHGGPAAGHLRLPAGPRHPEHPRRGGLQHRDRPAGAPRGEAGPVHRGVRWTDLPRPSSRTARCPSAPWPSARTPSTTSRSTC